MNELIKITENEQGVKIVSARLLYEFLEVKTDFTHWCKRMFDYGFEDGKDFTSFLTESNGGRPSIDYALTMDTAKEIAMVQRSEKGKQARLYFIEMEKVAKQTVPFNPFFTMSRKQMLQMAIESEEEKEALRLELKAANNENESLTIVTDLQKKQLQIAAPKVKYVDNVLKSESAHTTTVIAKGHGMSAISLNAVLHQKGVIFKTASGTWVLYAKYQDRGFTKTNTHSFTDSHGLTRTSINTVWTEIGRQFIHSIL